MIDELARHGAPLLHFRKLTGIFGILPRLLGEMGPGGNGENAARGLTAGWRSAKGKFRDHSGRVHFRCRTRQTQILGEVPGSMVTRWIERLYLDVSNRGAKTDWHPRARKFSRRQDQHLSNMRRSCKDALNSRSKNIVNTTYLQPD